MRVVGLVTRVEADTAACSSRQLACSARHEAVLDGGHRLLLLDDRGWAESGSPDIWESTTVAHVEDTARMVVGPDEPYPGQTVDDMEVAHWSSLTATLRRQGVDVDPTDLARLPHEVVLGEALRARLGRSR